MLTTQVGVLEGCNLINSQFNTGWIPGEQEDLTDVYDELTNPEGDLKKPVTVEYVASNQFKILGLDWTDRIQKYTRFRFKQGGEYKYFECIGVSANTGTLVTVDGHGEYEVEDAAITDFWFSNITNPVGWPEEWSLPSKIKSLETNIKFAKIKLKDFQTVLTGRIDPITRVPNYLSPGTGLSVDIAASEVPVRDTVAYGYHDDDSGERDIMLPAITTDITAAWSDLPPNQPTIFLYRGLDDEGNIEYGYTLLSPIYDIVPPADPEIDQHYYDINSRYMKRWNGSEWEIKIRVFHGEATTNEDSVTNVIAYALRGKYISPITEISGYNVKVFNCNIGCNNLEILINGRQNASYMWQPMNFDWTDSTTTHGVAAEAFTRNLVFIKAGFYVSPVIAGYSSRSFIDRTQTSGEIQVMVKRNF
jgi:hypothetical protein